MALAVLAAVTPVDVTAGSLVTVRSVRRNTSDKGRHIGADHLLPWSHAGGLQAAWLRREMIEESISGSENIPSSIDGGMAGS